jgi:hypothetical protein
MKESRAGDARLRSLTIEYGKAVACDAAAIATHSADETKVSHKVTFLKIR